MYETTTYLVHRATAAASRGRRRLIGEHGQGTVEYVALVMLIAVVMLGVITAVKSAKLAEGQQLASLLIKKIQEAVKQVRY